MSLDSIFSVLLRSFMLAALPKLAVAQDTKERFRAVNLIKNALIFAGENSADFTTTYKLPEINHTFLRAILELDSISKQTSPVEEPAQEKVEDTPLERWLDVVAPKSESESTSNVVVLTTTSTKPIEE